MTTTLPPLELWIDCPRAQVERPDYWDALVELGVGGAAIMLDSAEAGWDPSYSPRQLEGVARLALDRDIELIATTWAEPHRERIDRVVVAMAELLRVGVAAWELDAEGLWEAEDVRGFGSAEEAAAYQVAAMRRVCDGLDVRLELTTHMGHVEAHRGADLVPLVDRVYYQPYSTRRDWRGELVPWTSRSAPGARQRADLARVMREVPGLRDGRVALGVGQALWDQRWPGHDVAEALDLALAAALEYRPVSIRGWSSKWIMPGGARARRADQQRVSAWVRSTWAPRVEVT